MSRASVVWATLLLAASCAPAADAPAADALATDAPTAVEIAQQAATLSPVARSANGMVVSGSALATAVGVRVLEDGGNAIDAAVALAFALGVVEPSQSGIGGRTQILLRTAAGNVAAIDGTTEVPRAYTSGPTDDEGAYGYGTIAVPGTVAALAQALREHGTWPLARALEPAIALAEAGFILSDAEAARWAALRDRLAEFDGTRQTFLRDDGTPHAPGDTFRQPDLARTLRIIAEQGEDAFYRGEIAERMLTDLQANGSQLTREDIADYRAEPSIVVRGQYRDHELIGSYLPASGATTIEILQIMDRFDLSRIAGSAQWVSIVAQALLTGFEDREVEVTPAERKADWLVSTGLADERAAQIRAPDELRITRSPRTARGAPQDRSRNAGSQDRGAPVYEPAHTTHVSVADRAGNVVALTQSVGPSMGSKVVTPGLGFVYAATMEYLGELEPGTRRHWSSQSPLLIVHDDAPVWVLGGAGARRILSGLVETVSRALDQSLDPESAVTAPRFHPTPSRVDMEVREGTAWPDSVLAELRALGIRIDTRDSAPYFARINAIHRGPDGTWTGIADTRWEGASGAPRR